MSKKWIKKMFRKKVKEIGERERVRDAIRARKFSGPETFEQGLSMIKFAAKLWEAEK